MKSRKVNPISRSSFEKAMKALQSRLEETNRQISEYARAIQEASKGKGKVDLQNLDLFKSIERPIDPTKQTFEGTKRTLDEIIKSKNLRFDEILENLFYKPKSGAFLNTEPPDSTNIALAPTNNIFIIQQQGDNVTQPPTVSGDSIVVVGGGESDPIDAMYKYAEMTALQTA